jgi:energy-coupling factor transporter ATP-binding protein EcfA2
MFNDLKIEKLGKINLITGRNNCGKSSLLEALRIYGKRASPQILQELADMHDEVSRPIPASEDKSGDFGSLLPFKDFFSGRQFPSLDQSGIYIGDIEEKDFVKIDHIFYTEQIEEVVDANGETIRRRKRVPVQKTGLFSDELLAEQALSISTADTSAPGWIELGDTFKRPGYSIFWERLAKEVPVSYVPTRFLSMDYLAQLWDTVLFSAYADDVKSVLKIVDDQFEDLAFVDPGSFGAKSYERDRMGRRTRSERTAVVKLSSGSGSIPLNSMGEGMLRALQLGLTVYPAKGGLLLIDEFENGLHWSVQEKIWESLFRLSRLLDIQVFVVTHSSDSIRAFSAVSDRIKEDVALIRLVKTRPENPTRSIEAIVYDESILLDAIQAEVEVR